MEGVKENTDRLYRCQIYIMNSNHGGSDVTVDPDSKQRHHIAETYKSLENPVGLLAGYEFFYNERTVFALFSFYEMLDSLHHSKDGIRIIEQATDGYPSQILCNLEKIPSEVFEYYEMTPFTRIGEPDGRGGYNFEWPFTRPGIPPEDTLVFFVHSSEGRDY